MAATASLRRSTDHRGAAAKSTIAMQRNIYSFACLYGEFTVQLDHDSAPETCAYFARVFSSADFADASIFRIVTETNSSLRGSIPIEVIQFGIDHDGSRPFDQVTHERTKITGLKHERWAVSAARYGEGELYPSCFICMRDEPELDYGGKRNGDGQGFAVFGKVTSGFDTLEWIFTQAEPADYLKDTISVEMV